ncbi:MAG: flagellar basal body L-ring protein FlgH [Candidatus Hydrogenedentes bacterium]|nr:flagellar basal body L-ring protein FlgH [Candidatus Hydrogenedentota bacterium]
MRTALIAALSIGLAGLAQADSLFSPDAETRGSLVSNRHVEFHEGDIITVLVAETIDASTESNTNTKKKSEIESEALAGANTFLTNPKPNGLGLIKEELLPNWAIDMENEHRTTGTTDRSNRLTTTVSCTVTRVHDNGNIEIEGQKRVSVNREDSTVYVKGTVRGRDVSAANMISSTQIADAVIELRGRGPLWNNQRRGLITKLLDWFSPF